MAGAKGRDKCGSLDVEVLEHGVRAPASHQADGVVINDIGA